MPPLGYFGVESSGLNLVIDLLILFVVVVYLALIYWTYADARRRIVDPMLIGCATAASIFPFVGTVVYMILRPPEYLEDVHERELEMQAAEARLHDLDHALCPHCDYRIERDFLRCPSCLRKLKERCVSCSRPLDQAWTICPYCEADVPGIAPKRTRRSRPQPPVESELTQIDIEATPGETVAPVAATEPAARPRGGRSQRPRATS
jgi:RNA polymerase subunit RPABC4/transcription elongation factor Spt4